jgi:hypothetical protein
METGNLVGKIPHSQAGKLQKRMISFKEPIFRAGHMPVIPALRRLRQ